MIDGKKFKRYRKAAGLSIPQLAERLGMTRQAMWRIENEMKDPSLATAALIAHEMNCTVDDIIKPVQAS